MQYKGVISCMTASQLLILGNGFDLHCGLKSGYKDFFRNAILDTIKEKYHLQQMKVGVSGFWETLLFEYYKAYGNKDYNWCDIESIIKDTLWLVVFGEKYAESSNINHGVWKSAVECTKLNLDPQDESKDRDDSIKRYLYIYCAKFMYDLKARTRECLEEKKLQLLINHLLQELQNFERRFCNYIKNNIFDEQGILNEEYAVNAVNLLARLTGFSTPDFEDIDDIIDTEVKEVWEYVSPHQQISNLKNFNVLTEDFDKLKYTNILSFNYTAIFDILGVENPCAYNNVHGKLCSEQCTESCKATSAIFGIDDTLIQSQDSNSKLRLFSKTYRKMLNTNTPKSILPPNNNQAIEIKFYGHSLSEADYSYFQSIFDFYDLYENSNISLIFYYSKGYEQNDAIYRLINSYGKTLANKDRGKNMMHKLLLENRIKIVEIE